MFYDRKIKYVHLYEKGEKRQSVGFVKLEAVGDKVKVCVRISGLRYAYKEEGVLMAKGTTTESALGDICLEDGTGCLELKELPTEAVAEGISYEDLQEIILNISAGMMLRCIIRENTVEAKEEHVEETQGEEIHAEEIVTEKKQLTAEVFKNIHEEENIGRLEAELLREAFVEEQRMQEENVSETKVSAQEELREDAVEEIGGEEAPLVKVTPQIIRRNNTEISMSMAADKWQQLWNLYPHMKPFEDEREYLMMKPQDFVILQKQYYSLSSNSFLLHGYYNYEHLILCRVAKREKDAFYIGVPGNFYEKEKQVAVLFGFESFEGKMEPAGNGDFGYYMIPVEI